MTAYFWNPSDCLNFRLLSILSDSDNIICVNIFFPLYNLRNHQNLGSLKKVNNYMELFCHTWNVSKKNNNDPFIQGNSSVISGTFVNEFFTWNCLNKFYIKLVFKAIWSVSSNENFCFARTLTSRIVCDRASTSLWKITYQVMGICLLPDLKIKFLLPIKWRLNFFLLLCYGKAKHKVSLAIFKWKDW